MTARVAGSRLLELVGLTGFAFTQPILDTLGRSSGYLIFRGATRSGLFAAAAVIALVPPLVLWLATWPFTIVHRAVVASLAGVVAVLVLPETWWSLVPAAAAGAAVFVLHAREPAFRSWLRITAIGTPLFLVLLVTSPAADSLGDVEADLRAARGNGAPVVMVVLDELPTRTLLTDGGAIDEALFPNLAALAATSTWYRGASTVSPHTWHAVPSLLTGKLPFESAPSAADHPDTLFTLLGEHYELNVIESFERLCPTSLCERDEVAAREELDVGELVGIGRRVWEERIGLRDGEGTTGLVEPVAEAPVEPDAGEEASDERSEYAPDDRSLEEILGENHPQRFGALLDGIQASDGPVLHYVHLLLPHAPWRYLPDGSLYEPGTEFGVDGDRWRDDPWPPELARLRHRLQTQYIDRLLGQLVDRLEATGLFDRAVVVVTADHGISFEPGGGRRAIEGEQYDAATYADTMLVPLLVKAPGQRGGRVDDANVLSVDVLPTVAALLDIEVPWEVDGRPADEAAARDDEKPFFASTAGPFGVTPGEPRPQSAGALRGLLARDVPPPADANDPWRDYRIGPEAALVGRSLADAGSLVDVTDEVAFIGGDVAVAGHVERRADDDVVVVSAGGTVVGTSGLFTHDGRDTFAVIVPPDLATRGDLRVHLRTLR